MTISFLILIFTPIFLLPAFLLSHNRLRTYLFSIISATTVLIFIFLLDTFIPKIDLNYNIGKTFYPLWKFLLANNKELTDLERYHVSTSFTYLLIYFLTYILTFIPIKLIFIGTNPNIHKPIKTIQRISDIVLFIIGTYFVFALFIVEIRIILPFNDGFLSSIFSLIYKVEA